MSIFRKGENITDFYSIYEQLGQGSFSIVKEAANKSTNERVALKIIKKSMLGTEEAGSLENEVVSYYKYLPNFIDDFKSNRSPKYR